MSLRPLVALLLTSIALLALPGCASGRVRLAAPEDCLTNPNCGVGLRPICGIDITSAFVPLTVADAGITALDDGIAEIAVAFSSSPAGSRPDVVTVRDDRGMVGEDHVVPVVRRGTLRAYGKRARDIRRRLASTSPAAASAAWRRCCGGSAPRPLRPAAAENKNVFVMKREAAAALGVSKLSDLEAHWPAAG